MGKTCINASGRQSKILKTCYEDRVGERAKCNEKGHALLKTCPVYTILPQRFQQMESHQDRPPYPSCLSIQKHH